MTQQQALDLYNSNWWVGKSDREIALVQLAEERLICPWTVFHEAVDKFFPGITTHGFLMKDQLLSDILTGKAKEQP